MPNNTSNYNTVIPCKSSPTGYVEIHDDAPYATVEELQELISRLEGMTIEQLAAYRHARPLASVEVPIADEAVGLVQQGELAAE